MAATPVPRAAAIVDDDRGDVDALLVDLAAELQRSGRRVQGLVMTHRGGGRGCAAGAMVLVDLQTHDEYVVSQPLGQASGACRADPQGFARASQVLRRAVTAAPELVISNRFGGLEATGGGFAAELLDLMALDVPLLTVVATRHADAWSQFAGGAALLPAERPAIQAWLDDALGGHTNLAVTSASAAPHA